MKDILKLSAYEMSQKLIAGELTSVELTQACLDRIAEVDGKVQAFLLVDEQGAMHTARLVDEKRARGEELPAFAGVPVAIKDNICVNGMKTTCASKMLENWVSPYDATVISKIKKEMMPIIGKTNMDEFAMGSSTEHSAFQRTCNPWDLDRIPGGSGGGSAAAVAAYMVPLALGSDTGGSIRQPGAVTGTVGAKPTYGRISRYGLVAMASSLDQIGPVARTVQDAAMLQSIIGGYDEYDSTSLQEDAYDVVRALEENTDLSKMRIGIVKELSGEGYDKGVRDTFDNILDILKERGANIIEVSCPSFEYALSAYYLIMPAEVSSNLARFDGVHYGARILPKEGPVTAETMMATTRGEAFGDEVKRRIILGTYALSSGHVDDYYMSAQRVRTLIQRDFEAAYKEVDVLLSPTSPVVAFKFGDKMNDPLAMYLNDIATIPANLAGIPGISIPAGLSQGLPVGLQVLAPAHKDARMYAVANEIEKILNPIWGGNILEQAPVLEGE
ncbi:Asp-tRNA(Asn)/Glu-tRNA(Gln) amidotransferase subunit GatA [Actinomyces sp. zg-332]|uniref:Asp-tRNA(Asn)/Glu-tRNA(Gln) amidotransferase subunit GatA n=1 Tax=Actinomyces sp. zg-332 TaxID=2708340 RepID=UPI0014246AEC|nr:Asp-tRNA(Asn)/Glu-tRNA(Gln) amidotransferase subunit GatA [Actinomyces sp. zg-332]QPK93906.1 Asp-tRNA(Asn)/Glu-tRNA(Gln) amidotransferase subunit GatA [Actinomyces sp. zg-332]